MTSNSYATVAGDTFTGVITFVNTMGLGTDTTSSRLALYPGSKTTDWYGMGRAAGKVVYNVPAALTHFLHSSRSASSYNANYPANINSVC